MDPRRYYKLIFANKFDNLDEGEKSRQQNLFKTTARNWNLNSSVSVEDIEYVIFISCNTFIFIFLNFFKEKK